METSPLKFTKFTLIGLALGLAVTWPQAGFSQMEELMSKIKIIPQKGQSNAKKQQDAMQCGEVAQGQLQKMKEEASQDPESKRQGQVARSAAGGAAVGAIGGTIRGDTGRGAAFGAVRGGIRGEVREKMVEKKQAEAKKKAAENAFLVSFSTCMQERGYVVNY